MEPKDSKQALRRNVIAKRKATTITERRQAGEALARGIDALPLPRQQRTVAAFLSMGSEIETRPLLHALAEQGYRILLPRLGSGLDIGWGEYSDLPIEDLGMHRPQEPSGDTLPADALGTSRARAGSRRCWSIFMERDWDEAEAGMTGAGPLCARHADGGHMLALGGGSHRPSPRKTRHSRHRHVHAARLLAHRLSSSVIRRSRVRAPTRI